MEQIAIYYFTTLILIAIYLILLINPLKRLIQDKIYFELSTLRSRLYNLDRENEGLLSNKLYSNIRSIIIGFKTHCKEVTIWNVFFLKDKHNSKVNAQRIEVDEIFSQVKQINNSELNLIMSRLNVIIFLNLFNSTLFLLPVYFLLGLILYISVYLNEIKNKLLNIGQQTNSLVENYLNKFSIQVLRKDNCYL